MHSNRRRILALLISAALLALSGCEKGSEKTSAAANISLPEPEAQTDRMILGEQQAGGWHDVTLYYIGADGTSLSPDFRMLRCETDETLAECALRELLNAPNSTDQFSVAPGDTRLLSIEQSGGIATVHLSIDARGVQSGQELYMMYAAISATLLQFDSIHGVNILIGGQSESVFLLPTGIMRDHYDISAGTIAQLQAESERFLGSDRAARGTITRDAVLYFPTKSRDLIPEARTLTFTDENYAYTLIEALKAGPENSQNCTAPMPQGLEILSAMPGISVSGNGMRILDLQFNSMLSSYLPLADLTPSQFAASVALTMCSFIPELDGVRITIDGEPLSEIQFSGTAIPLDGGLHTRMAYSDQIGASAPLYLAGEGGGLFIQERIVSQEIARSPRLLLEELFSIPVSETHPASALPGGISSLDILGVLVENGVAHVNLSGNFYRQCQLMDDEQERNAVYAIVNTLCSLDSINGVQFLIEGSTADLMVGNIYLRSMLIYNPGLVEN